MGKLRPKERLVWGLTAGYLKLEFMLTILLIIATCSLKWVAVWLECIEGLWVEGLGVVAGRGRDPSAGTVVGNSHSPEAIGSGVKHRQAQETQGSTQLSSLCSLLKILFLVFFLQPISTTFFFSSFLNISHRTVNHFAFSTNYMTSQKYKFWN